MAADIAAMLRYCLASWGLLPCFSRGFVIMSNLVRDIESDYAIRRSGYRRRTRRV